MVMVYSIFPFYLQYQCDMSCDEPVAIFVRESMILWTCVLSISEVNFIVAIERLLNCFLSSFLYFVVRVLRCRRKKFTFAIASADEFLVRLCGHPNIQ